jgi:SAM-dependent methyltransferase
VGSLNVNGSLRSLIEPHQPSLYLGVDVAHGLGVDEICDIHELVPRYGRDRFDVVVCTELLEHVKEWRSGISNLKNVLRKGGILCVTTRSKGFPYHGYPNDFWRYDPDDFKVIFSDFFIEHLTSDPSAPGVFLKAHKQAPFREARIDSHRLYSVLKNKRCGDVNPFDIFLHKTLRFARSRMAHHFPSSVKSKLRRILPAGRCPRLYS